MRKRLLHQVKAEQGTQRRDGPGAQATELRQRRTVHVVALALRENTQRASTLGSQARPCPAHQECDLRQVVLVLDGPHPLDAALREVCRQLLQAAAAGSHDGVGNVERQWVPAELAREPRNTWKRWSPFGDPGRRHREHHHASEQAPARGDDERDLRSAQGVEQARHGAIVLVVVEDDQARAAGVEEPPQPPDDGAPGPGRSEAQGHHLGEGGEVPGAHPEPVNPIAEERRQMMPQRRRQHRLSASARPHQGQPRRRRVANERRQGAQLFVAPSQALGRRREKARYRLALPGRHTRILAPDRAANKASVRRSVRFPSPAKVCRAAPPEPALRRRRAPPLPAH